MLLRLCAAALLARGAAGGGDDLWRPRVHFYFRDPLTGVGFHSNDATGSYFDERSGTWLAFYDCSPPPAYVARANGTDGYSWCEASSTDLVRWAQAARAVLPMDSPCDWENLETGAIARAPASGELVAIFSAKGNESHPPGAPEWEHVCAARGGAVADDDGGAAAPRVFHVLDAILIENANNGSGFRDPSRAVRLADGNDYVVIGTDAGYQPPGDRGAGASAKLAQASLWVNRDGSLLSWAPAGVLLADASVGFPECPDLFPLEPLAEEREAAGEGGSGGGGGGRDDDGVDDDDEPQYVLLASETYRNGTRYYLGPLRANADAGVGYRLEPADAGALDHGFGTHDMACVVPR